MNDDDANATPSAVAESAAQILERLGVARPPVLTPEQAAEMDRRGAEHDAREARRVAGERLRRRRDMLRGVPLRDEDVNAIVVGELRESTALVHVRGWQANRADRPWLILCGGVGTGKTVAAAAAMVDEDRAPTFCRAQDLARRLDPWKGERDDDRIGTGGPLFVLDDLGAERDSGDARFRAAMFQLVDERQSRPTIVTANILRAVFRERYDARVVDRLNAICRAVEIGGESMRVGGGGL